MLNCSAQTGLARKGAISPVRSSDMANMVFKSSVAIGEQIDLVFEFDSPGGNWMFQCNGEIVRIEDRDGKVALAVKVHESIMGSA